MSQHTHTLEVDCPVRTVYDQWTQFETFPEFMEGVRAVRQVDDTHSAWDVEIAGIERHFDATVVEQVPDRVVSWTTTDGAMHAGQVRFTPLDPARTEVTLSLDFEPEGLAEKSGEALGIVDSRVKGDLKRFKEFIEERGVETGAWRGEVHGGRTDDGDDRPPGIDAMPG
jgi:uncharacterized membrane protein